MLDKFWNEFIDVKVAEQYYLLYVHYSQKCVWAINGLALIVTFSGITAWTTAYLTPFLSSLIILIAQIISALQPLYPYAERVYASECIYNDLKQISMTAEQMINRVLFGNMEESELQPHLEELQKALHLTEAKYTSPRLFSWNSRIHRKAQKVVDQELKNHFNLDGVVNK